MAFISPVFFPKGKEFGLAAS